MTRDDKEGDESQNRLRKSVFEQTNLKLSIEIRGAALNLGIS